MAVINPGGSGSASIIGSSQGLAAAKPATPTGPGQLYFATDTGELWIANAAGNAWQSIAQTSAANFSVASQVTYGINGFHLVNNGSNGIEASNGVLGVSVAGSGLVVKEGSNAKQGTIGAMTAGSIAVANTSVTANSRIFVCRNAGGTNPGAWYVSAQTAGTGFTATSTNAADTGTGVFVIFEPG